MVEFMVESSWQIVNVTLVVNGNVAPMRSEHVSPEQHDPRLTPSA